MAPTWRSCLSHLGATLGMASFSWAGRRGTPERAWGAPICMEVRIEVSTGSFREMVFSTHDNAPVSHRQSRPQFVTTRRQGPPLTADGVVLDAEQLGFVVARDRGVRVDVARQHRQGSRQVRRHVLATRLLIESRLTSIFLYNMRAALPI